MSARAYVALGSNLGEREVRLESALVQLAELHGVTLVARSSWIETEPVGGPPGQGRFLNGAAALDVTLEARALLRAMQAIEERSGRVRTVRDGPRTLDLDLLLFGQVRLEEAFLQLPHPRLEERAFVLEPLAQIAPDLVLPRSGISVRARLAELLVSAGPPARSGL